MKTAFFVLLLTLALPNLAVMASEEDYLEWNTIVITCASTPDTGDIACEITTGEKGWKSFNIRAFDKQYALPEADLKKLEEFSLSSIRISHTAGYEQLGGHTVHFRFERTFYNSDTKLVTQSIYVSVTKAEVTVSQRNTKVYPDAQVETPNPD